MHTGMMYRSICLVNTFTSVLDIRNAKIQMFL